MEGLREAWRAAGTCQSFSWGASRAWPRPWAPEACEWCVVLGFPPTQELGGIPPLLLAVNLRGGPGLESRGPSCSVGLLTILSTVGAPAWAGLALGSTHTLTSCAHGSSLGACPRSQLCSCFCLFPRRLGGAKPVLVMAVLGCVGHVGGSPAGLLSAHRVGCILCTFCEPSPVLNLRCIGPASTSYWVCESGSPPPSPLCPRIFLLDDGQ